MLKKLLKKYAEGGKKPSIQLIGTIFIRRTRSISTLKGMPVVLINKGKGCLETFEIISLTKLQEKRHSLVHKMFVGELNLLSQIV